MYKHGKNVSPCLDNDNRHADVGEGKAHETSTLDKELKANKKC